MLSRYGPWLLFALWMLVQVPAALRPEAQGVGRIDFLSYRRAAEAVARGERPYLSVAESQRIWRLFHRNESDLLAAAARGAGREELRAQQARPPQPGPYLYPPTLALLVAGLHLDSPVFSLLSLLSVVGFAWLWLHSADAGSVWLLLLVASWDLLATALGGNVELLLVGATLLVARLLWDDRPLWAAPPLALVLLVKPFYVLFFASFGVFRLLAGAGRRAQVLRTFLMAAAASAALVAVEVVRWGPDLQAATLAYLRHALDYQWFALPLPEQTPMSAWNRTAMQALANAGLPPTAAQWVAYSLWLALTALTGWRLWRPRAAPLPFSLAFGLAFVLLYWARPVGWTFVYLEFVVAGSAWPWLRRGERVVLLTGLLALMASHWGALARTVAGQDESFLTLQTARVPWEAWLALPLCWLALLGAAARLRSGHPAAGTTS